MCGNLNFSLAIKLDGDCVPHRNRFTSHLVDAKISSISWSWCHICCCIFVGSPTYIRCWDHSKKKRTFPRFSKLQNILQKRIISSIVPCVNKWFMISLYRNLLVWRLLPKLCLINFYRCGGNYCILFIGKHFIRFSFNHVQFVQHTFVLK